MLMAENYSFEMHQYQLINDYFDNDDLDLRKIDFGLRIRAKTILNKKKIKISLNSLNKQ